ncbi:hypothetical protein [Paracoccus suum]|uniref:hypothetical protein n=1 Tax=Paracoccus suum TaxID=2259340 RepID=UPI001F543C6A|nr:hypothetical protein [Paracoccus suum]
MDDEFHGREIIVQKQNFIHRWALRARFGANVKIDLVVMVVIATGVIRWPGHQPVRGQDGGYFHRDHEASVSMEELRQHQNIGRTPADGRAAPGSNCDRRCGRREQAQAGGEGDFAPPDGKTWQIASFFLQSTMVLSVY